MNEKHIISVLVENHSGVLAKIAGLISGRGFNIDSLAVGETHDPTVSRMTIVTVGDHGILEQIIKQLDKIIDVIKVEDISKDDLMDRELMLCKVAADADTRQDIMQIINTFRAKVVDVNPDTVAIEVTGSESKIDAVLELLDPFGIVEVVRTGEIALSRKRTLQAPSKDDLKYRKVTAKEIGPRKKASGKSKKQKRQMAKDGY